MGKPYGARATIKSHISADMARENGPLYNVVKTVQFCQVLSHKSGQNSETRSTQQDYKNS